jgi:hypothetical protein
MALGFEQHRIEQLGGESAALNLDRQSNIVWQDDAAARPLMQVTGSVRVAIDRNTENGPSLAISFWWCYDRLR